MMQKHSSSVKNRKIACKDCDLLQEIPDLEIDQKAHCIRCDAVLLKRQKNSVDRSLAFALSGLILYFISHMFPLLSLKALGFIQEETLLSTSIALFKSEMPVLSIVLLFTTVVFPLTSLLGTSYILIQVKRNKFNNYTAPVFRFLHNTEAWGMLEIFMLAVLVSMVKLGDVAELIFGLSLYAFGFLILSLTCLAHSLNPEDVWSKLRDNSSIHES